MTAILDERGFLAEADAVATAAAVKGGKISAKVAVSATLDRIVDRDRTLNCFATADGSR